MTNNLGGYGKRWTPAEDEFIINAVANNPFNLSAVFDAIGSDDDIVKYKPGVNLDRSSYSIQTRWSKHLSKRITTAAFAIIHLPSGHTTHHNTKNIAAPLAIKLKPYNGH